MEKNKLRKLISDIYEYQIDNIQSNELGLDEDMVINHLMGKYDHATYARVKLRVDELKKINFLENLENNKVKITKEGYHARRVLKNTKIIIPLCIIGGIFLLLIIIALSS